MSKELAAYLSDMQTKALQLECLAEALNAVIDYKEHHDIAVALLAKIQSMADELNNGLDSVSLRKIGGAE